MANDAKTLLALGQSLKYGALSDRDLKESIAGMITSNPPSSNAQTLANLAATLNYSSLSERDMLVALAGYLGNATNNTAATSLTDAAIGKYGALSDRDLDEAILTALT